MPTKTYYLIHLYFGHGNENAYTVYAYEKSRRFTAGQAWRHIRQGIGPVLSMGNLPGQATIYADQGIIERLGLDAGRCDTYQTFGFMS